MKNNKSNTYLPVHILLHTPMILIIIQLENLVANRWKGEFYLNDILLLGPNKDIFVFSTLQGSGNKFYFKISNYDVNSLDKILNFLKSFTWNIQPNGSIKSSSFDSSTSLKKHIKETYSSECCIKSYKTTPRLKEILNKIHKL